MGWLFDHSHSNGHGNALMPVFEGGFDISDKLALAERRIFSLTEEQCRTLDFIRNHRQVLIQGCAGSGKSVMAVKKTRELAADPKCRVLLLAWNEMISDRLAAAVSDLPNVTAMNYHGFCLAQLRAAGQSPNPPLSYEEYQVWLREHQLEPAIIYPK